MKAMLLAAGLGTRLKPFTDKHPKALAIVNKKSLLQRNIEYLSAFGIKEIIINVHHFSEQVIAEIKSNNGFGSNITISDETDEVLETGGGLKKAALFLDNEKQFVLMNVDVLTDLDLDKMIHQHLLKKSLATLAVTNRKTSRYFLFDANENLCGWINEKAKEEIISRKKEMYSKKAFSGIHIISSKIFSLIKRKGKFSIVDIYLELCESHAITAFDHSGSKFIDVGRSQSIEEAEKIFI